MVRYILNFLFLLVFINLIFDTVPSGECSQGLNKNIKEGDSALSREKLREIEERIRSYKERLNREKAKEFSVLSEMNGLNNRLNALRSRINDLRKRLKDTESNISKTEKEKEVLRQDIEKRRMWLKTRLRNISRYGYMKEVDLLFQSSDMGELLRNLRYLEMLSVYEKRMLDSLRSDMETLLRKDRELKALKEEQRKTLDSIRAEEKEVFLKQKEKSYILAYVKKRKDFYEKMIRELNEAAKELNRIIKEAEKHDVKDTGFLSKRGRLIWPVNGSLKIPYGYHKDPDTGVPIFRSGIHIMADEDGVKAVYKGNVSYVGELRGYGKVIILTHGGGYYSVYANLSEIFLKQGDIILEGQLLGKTGESAILEGKGLYFEIRYKGKPLDPLQWLRRR